MPVVLKCFDRIAAANENKHWEKSGATFQSTSKWENNVDFCSRLYEHVQNRNKLEEKLNLSLLQCAAHAKK